MADCKLNDCIWHAYFYWPHPCNLYMEGVMIVTSERELAIILIFSYLQLSMANDIAVKLNPALHTCAWCVHAYMCVSMHSWE